MAIAGCRKPAAGWKTLVFRDDLRFFNRNNPGDLLKLVEELLTEQEYYQAATANSIPTWQAACPPQPRLASCAGHFSGSERGLVRMRIAGMESPGSLPVRDG